MRVFPQAVKPDVDLMGFIGLTEVMPFYEAFENSSASRDSRDEILTRGTQK
jgi:hypothetical protein